MTHSRNIALVLAGGTGERMRAQVPKQFMTIDGETILRHTLRAFQQHALIHEILLVCLPEWEEFAWQEARNGGIDKLSTIIGAGENSFASARNGIRHLSARADVDDAIVLIHDVVRPLITQDIISRNIAVCLTHGNAITALPSNEAYLAIAADGTGTDVLPREGLMRAQTPHTFPLNVLSAMMKMADEQGIDESQSIFTLAGQLGFVPLHVARGDVRNFKITEQSDILIYRALKAIEE